MKQALHGSVDSRRHTSLGGTWAGLSAIFRKEVSDAVSSGAFFLSLAAFVLTIVLTGFASGYAYSKIDWLVKLHPNQAPNYYLMIIRNLAPTITLLGVIVAVAYGFNMVNKEKTSNSLKVLLNYPVYRDQVILGKLLAGIFVMFIASFASIVVAFGIFMFYSGTIPTAEMMLRFSVFYMLTFLLLIGWMGLSVFISLAFKEAKTSLLMSFMLIGLFNSSVLQDYGLLLAKIIRGPLTILTSDGVVTNTSTAALTDLISNLLSSSGFYQLSNWLSLPQMGTWVGSDYVQVSSTALNIVTNNIYSVIALGLLPIITFLASYILFTKTDVY